MVGSEKKPYARYAFNNLYNYTFMGAACAMALVSGSWIPFIVGVGIEAAWIVNASSSRLLQRLWLDKVHDQKLREAQRRYREAQIARLEPGQGARVRALDAKETEILRLASENRQLPRDLLQEEMVKLDRLVDLFLHLTLDCQRFEGYLATVDFDELVVQIRAYRRTAEKERDEGLRETARKNLDVLLQRQKELKELARFAAGARAQLDLIENTFQLIEDQILAMSNPAELGGRLDELIDGMEDIRGAAAERARLLASL